MSVILSVDALCKTFKQGRSRIRAVHNVSLDVNVGETLGLVGESGCGKSTLARLLVGLQSPDSGRISIDGLASSEASRSATEQGRLIQYVFQNSSGALNSRKSIRQILDAPLHYLMKLSDAQKNDRIVELIDAVGLRRDVLGRYPHELSGGQAQRIGIARALAASPRILVLDEPVSALDVSVQAQVLDLLTQLRDRFELTYIFISHDLGVVEAVSDRVAVMYFGSVVELGSAHCIFEKPGHPYSARLADSARRVVFDDEQGTRSSVELPDPAKPPLGCAYHDRCNRALSECKLQVPPLKAATHHDRVACFNPLT